MRLYGGRSQKPRDKYESFLDRMNACECTKNMGPCIADVRAHVYAMFSPVPLRFRVRMIHERLPKSQIFSRVQSILDREVLLVHDARNRYEFPIRKKNY